MKTLVAVVAIQLIYAGYFLLTKVAFDVGMNTFVLFSLQTGCCFPFLGSIAIFSNATNTLPVITFFLAVLFRMEKVNIRTSAGMMKVGGVTACIGGAATIALYRGPYLKLLLHHHLINTTHLHAAHPPSANTWIKGVALILLSNLTWAFWLVLQGRVLKSYPSKLLLTTLQCFMSTIQSFLVAVVFARDPAQWKLGWSISLLSVAYCGIVVTGVAFYLQALVVEKKGPVSYP
ncbi:WAT1-related protein [Sesamum angolense]|uniref:WAT1-related protein n=1 Tax=Sesamum angolense TaxID=2727404 RepID=A0AAE2C7J9_9LAMI|nr:WAT1-related protein [Sesamum angolense]